jgi:hypothetical protein
MEFFERAKSLADQAATRAKEGVEEGKLILDLKRTYLDLGKLTFELVDRSELEDARLQSLVDRIRGLETDLKERRKSSGRTSADTGSTDEASRPAG